MEQARTMPSWEELYAFTPKDIRERYGDIYVGHEYFDRTPEVMWRYILEFELARKHLLICRECQATRIERLAEKDESPWVHYVIKDCPLNTRGFWFGLSKATKQAKKPVFSWHNCAGPDWRREELASRWRWRGEAYEKVGEE